jgi:hypothetical protein
MTHVTRLAEAMQRDEAWSTFWSLDDAKLLVKAIMKEQLEIELEDERLVAESDGQ